MGITTKSLTHCKYLLSLAPKDPMATKKSLPAKIADNKKAAFNYFFDEKFEAGIVLEGWEVKSLREGKVQLTDGYVVIRNGELFVIGCQSFAYGV